MTYHFIHNYRAAREHAARQVLDAVHGSFTAAFQEVLVRMLSQVLNCDLERAKIIYLAPEAPEARLRLLHDLIELEIPKEPVTQLLLDCIDELRRLERWTAIELGGSLTDASLGDFLWQAGRTAAIYRILLAICGEPVPCKQEAPSVNNVREWASFAFDPPFAYGAVLH